MKFLVLPLILDVYLDHNQFICLWVKIQVIVYAGYIWLSCKLQRDGRIDCADVLVEFETAQYETKVDVGTNAFICRRVVSDSRSLCAVYRFRCAVL